MSELTASERVQIARHTNRPKAMDYIEGIFTDFFELRGDRFSADDESIVCGIALYKGQPVTVIGQRKGRTVDENIRFNFGMPQPEGYRKVQRVAKQAEKFKRPIITFIDTPGAYPGLEAEEHGQGEAIARCLEIFSGLKVPVIAIVIGEGGSGGALALGVANEIIMLENSIYSILSPEGFASILWRDSEKSAEACEVMKLTAADLFQLGIVDKVIPEPEGGAQTDPDKVINAVDVEIGKKLNLLLNSSGTTLAEARYQKFRMIGNIRQ